MQLINFYYRLGKAGLSILIGHLAMIFLRLKFHIVRSDCTDSARRPSGDTKILEVASCSSNTHPFFQKRGNKITVTIFIKLENTRPLLLLRTYSI